MEVNVQRYSKDQLNEQYMFYESTGSPPYMNRDYSSDIQSPYVSEKEYWEKYYDLPDISYEWNNGVLEEKTMADFESFQMYLWYVNILLEYLKNYKEGMLVGLDIGFKMNLDRKRKSIRKPDLALIHKNNPVQMKPRETTYRGIFDICFEFLSDTTRVNIERDTVVKKLEYEQAGIKEYFILDRKGYYTKFYRLDKNGRYRTIRSSNDGVIKSKVLPLFQFREKDMYRRSEDLQLISDPVYNYYYKTNLKKELEQERNKAEQERRIAEQERNKAEQERNKAEQERNKAEQERNKAEQERRIAEQERRKAAQEKQRADHAEMMAKKAIMELEKLKSEMKAY